MVDVVGAKQGSAMDPMADPEAQRDTCGRSTCCFVYVTYCNK